MCASCTKLDAQHVGGVEETVNKLDLLISAVHTLFSGRTHVMRALAISNPGFKGHETCLCVSHSVFSVVPDSVTPWAVAYQAPLSMEFSRQEYWSGLSFPNPGDFHNPGIEPGSPALQEDCLPSEPSG